MDHLLPAALLDSLEGVKGFEREAFERVHAAGGAPVSIRFNPGKKKDGVDASLRRVPWCASGYYLPERPSFTMDPLFHAGVYYVQEASSMFLEQALRQCLDMGQPLRVLDCCAAPGGKSTLIESLLSPGSLLVSNEVIKTRASILQENMIKWGGISTVVSSNDPRDIGRMESYFDVIVVDAPCSGSGLFRREPEAIGEWSPGNVALCSQRQQRILADVWPALRQGGLMVYSTCSYSREEDEAILDWMMESFEVEGCRLAVDPGWGIVESSGAKGGWAYRFFPDKVEGEGLFVTVLRKLDGGEFGAWPKVKKSLSERLGKADVGRVEKWVSTEEPLYFFRQNDLIHVLPEVLREDLGYLQSMLYLKKAGVTMGKLAGDELIPEHELAVSRIVADLPSVELSREDAIRYLRKEDISLEYTRKGWTLVRHQGINLGWVKILPNRVNNYYPKEWRILKRDPV